MIVIEITSNQFLYSLVGWLTIGFGLIYWVARKQFDRRDPGNWVMCVLGVVLWPAIIIENFVYCRVENERRLFSAISKYQDRFGRLPNNEILKVLKQQSKLPFSAYINYQGIRCLY